MKNRSLTARQHLAEKHSSEKHSSENPLPASKRSLTARQHPAEKHSSEKHSSENPLPASEQPNGGIRKHKRPCVDSGVVTVYALVFLPTGKRVYTGRTKDPERRLSQHASKGSKCRLVRNAFRKHGRKAFGLEPILRCRASDADTNETYWIIQNKTLYPDGYNLRHGSAAGEEQDGLDTSIVPVCTGVVPFKGIADEARACAEGWEDVAEMVDGMDETSNEANHLCRDLLRQIHPDVQGGHSRSYSADEVAAMLNAVREMVS